MALIAFHMFHFGSSVLHKAASTGHKIALYGRICPLVTLLVLMQFLVYAPVCQKACAQEQSQDEISDLTARLEYVEEKLIEVDAEIVSLEKEFTAVTNEMNALKDETTKPKGIWDRITGIFRSPEKKLGELFSRSKQLDARMRDLRQEREILASKLVALADELIEKSSALMAVSMEVLRVAAVNNDAKTWEEASKQWSSLWDLAERARKIRARYIPDTQEARTAPPVLLSDDPDDLKLYAAALKDAAEMEQAEVARLEKKIADLELKEDQWRRELEIIREMQRREEENEATGIGLSQIPWGGEADTQRKIEDISREIEDLKAEKQIYEDKAERYQQQAEEIEARLEGNSENDQ